MKLMNGKHTTTETVPSTLDEIRLRLDVGAARMQTMEQNQIDMKSELAANTVITEEIRDFLDAARMGFKVIGALGAVAKWLGILATAALAVYTAFYALTHHGATPK